MFINTKLDFHKHTFCLKDRLTIDNKGSYPRIVNVAFIIIKRED